MSDAAQIVECEKSPTGNHLWWQMTWGGIALSNDVTTDNSVPYCLYCGKKKSAPAHVVTVNGGSDDSHGS